MDDKLIREFNALPEATQQSFNLDTVKKYDIPGSAHILGNINHLMNTGQPTKKLLQDVKAIIRANRKT